MIRIKAFIVLLLFSISCASQEKKVQKDESNDAVVKSDIEDIEYFTDFLNLFSDDSVFQLTRIIFPFEDCSVESTGDSLCIEVKEVDWHHIALVEDGVISSIDNEFILPDHNKGDYKVFSINNIENGTGSFYYFKREKGKWYLRRRLSYE